MRTYHSYGGGEAESSKQQKISSSPKVTMKTSGDGTEEGEQKRNEKEKRNDKPKVTFILKKKSDKFKDNKYKDLTLKLSLTMSNSF